jgi:prepilin peptidase CpaA
MPLLIQYALYALFPLMLAYAAASDLLTMTISNRISMVLVAGFVVLAPLTGMSISTFAMHWAAGAAMLALTFSLFAMGWIGGGDAKIAAVVTLWFGWTPETVNFVGIASIYGGILTVAILAFRNAPVPAFIVRPAWVQRLFDPEEGVPYGIALTAGALMVYPQTIWMRMVIN